MQEDNLLLRNHYFQKGLAVVVGKPIVENSIKQLFNISDTTQKEKNVNYIVKHNYKEYLDEYVYFILTEFYIAKMYLY